MNLRSALYVVCGAAVLFTSCNKGTNPDAFNYTFQNTTGKAIHVDVYGSFSDYMNNANPVATGVANANGNLVVRSSTLHTDVPYYADWYSDDYTYTNWVSREDLYTAFNPRFTASVQTNLMKLESEMDYARLLCLHGNATSTTWLATDGFSYVYSNGGSDSVLWNNLPQNDKFFQIVFHKDFTMTFSYIAPDGQRADVTLIMRTDAKGTPAGSTKGHLSLYYNSSKYDENGQLNKAGDIYYTLSGPAGDADVVPTDNIEVTIKNIGTFSLTRQTIN